ncbi:MAG: ATP-binding protein [Bdellovibrionota bacterium]
MFERFEHAVSPNEVTGLGLGLFIAKEILEKHGGSISVASEPGGGSIFTVNLPMDGSMVLKNVS